MKYRSALLSLLAALLSASGALAQSQDSVPEIPTRIIAARCAYAPADESCSANPEANQEPPRPGDGTVAQAPRQAPSTPMGRPMRYPPMPYRARWMERPSGGHVLIGALIGFGLGAAVAAQGHTSAGGIVTAGAICGAIGAGLVISMPPFPTRYRYRGPWDYEEEARSRRHHPRRPRKDSEVQMATLQP